MLGQRPVTLLRYGAVTVTAGRGALPAPSTSTIQANVQPPSGAQLRRLPEELRAKVDQWMLTETLVRTVDNQAATPQLADRITVDGATYEVQWVRTWHAAGPLPHYEAGLVRIDETGGSP